MDPNSGNIDYALAEIIRLKLSEFMKAERIIKGRSVRTLARKLKIKRKHIHKWEAGKRSPPASTMMTIFQHYGRETLGRFLELDFEFQKLKYDRSLRKLSKD